MSDKNKCFWCGKILIKNQITRDHVIFKCVGGRRAQENLVIACAECNLDRGKVTSYHGEKIQILKNKNPRKYKKIKNVPLTELNDRMKLFIKMANNFNGRLESRMSVINRWIKLEKSKLNFSPSERLNIDKIDTNMTKILAISDLHGHLPKIEECDLLLIAGDICPYVDVIQQLNWIENKLRPWLNEIPAKEIVACAGNHDWIFFNSSHLVPKDLRWHYLQDQLIQLFDLKIYGTPWQPTFCNWAFNLPEEQLKEKFSKIPDNIDILVSHGPPYGYGDKVDNEYTNKEKFPDGEHVGSTSLRDKILKIKPKFVVVGHVHCSRGVYSHKGIVIANCSIVNEKYEHVHEPITWSL